MYTLFYDTKLIFLRSVQISLRNPVWVMFGLFQPLCYLLLFGPLLEGFVAVPGFGGNALTVFTPGLLVMIALFGTAFVGFSLIDDIRAGVIERFRVTPISRIAIFLGRTLRDVAALFIQVIFLLSVAWLKGLSVPLFAVVLSLGIVGLIGFSMSIISYCIAFILQSEDALAPVLNFFLLPLQLLAGIMLPLTLAPQWLQTLAKLNPLSHAVNAVRALFLGNYTDVAVFYGFGSMIMVAVLVFCCAARLFKKGNE
jgi:ABC-2 type transport system permease protein